MLDRQIADVFVSLVRLGIGHSIKVLPDAIDWQTIHSLSSKHGLTAIVLDGVQKLTDDGVLDGGRKMDVALKKKWIGSVIQNYEWKYEDYRTRIGQLAHFYNNHGFRLMILK